MRRFLFFFKLFLLVLVLPAKAQVPESAKAHYFKDCSDCPDMTIIPAGTFLIGSPITEPGRFSTEGPQRNIDIQSLAVSKFDVTRSQWNAFVTATSRPTQGGCAWSGLNDSLKPWESDPRANWNHLGFAQDDNHPVVCISASDADDYVQWLSKKTGKHYRLLTEAEWEYAARGGTTTAYPWGATASHDFANYGLDSGYKGLAIGRDRWKETSPVGSFPPNPFGLYDMQGNVLQFVQDCFEESYDSLSPSGAPYAANATLRLQGHFKFMNGTNACDYRCVRGGDWGDPPQMIRSAFRNWAPGRGSTLNTYRSAGLGFRVARNL